MTDPVVPPLFAGNVIVPLSTPVGLTVKGVGVERLLTKLSLSPMRVAVLDKSRRHEGQRSER